MATQEFPGDPKGQAVFDALLTANVPPKEAYNAPREIRDMAGANLDAKIDSLRWMMGLLIALVAALLIAVLTVALAFRESPSASAPAPIQLVVPRDAIPPAPEPAPAGEPETAPSDAPTG